VRLLEHNDILPFYGASTTIADFCLVFPWCKNGNIVEYLKRKPDISRFTLVSMFKKASCSGHLLAPTNSCLV